MSIHSRTNPFQARIKERYLLNREGASKETFHIALELDGNKLPFQVGDSIAIFPENDPKLVRSILHTLQLTGSEDLFDPRTKTTLPIVDFLRHKANLSKCTSSFLKMMKERGAEGLDDLLAPENKSRLAECLQTHHLGDLLRIFKGSRLSAQDLTTLLPLMPRFYSIASSPRMHPEEIHLTVASLSFKAHGETRYGVGSHFLCQMAKISETPIPLYVQPSNGFSLPEPDASMIMIGPGTGIAPFRAFLQERIALQHKGRNWLFFGERNRSTDFYYSDFFLELVKQNRLRLDLAFSRDQAEKVYVQHKLWEERASVYEWLQSGAYLYVCGDAEKMAKDVDLTLQRIVQDQAQMGEEDARYWLKKLRQSKHYLQDVY